MIPLYGCNASGNTIRTLDEVGLDTDMGAAFVAWLKSGVFDPGPASAWATLRTTAQVVAVGGSANVRITPIGDGAEYTDQAQDFALSSTGGPEQVLDAHADVPAARFQVKVEVLTHTGITELGESDQWLVIRRPSRL